MKPWEKNSKDPLFNEFYTNKEMCECLFSEMIPIINEQTNKKTLRVCCPCDGELSEIPKYLREHSDWEVDNFGDLDVNGEEARERMLKADVIITNPPFTQDVWRPFITWLIENKKPFFIFGSYLQRYTVKYVMEHANIFGPKIHKSNMYDFNRPDGTQKTVALITFYTSFKVPKYKYPYRPAKEEQFYEGIPVYDRVNNVPPDYMGWMYVPITSLYYLQPVEIDEEKTMTGVPGKYIRVCVRRRSI